MKKKKGFTLIEIIIVVIVLSLVATLVVPKFFKKVEQSKRKIAKTQIVMLENGIKLFKLDTGRYPTTAESLRALLEKPVDTPNWDGPYLEKGLPKDPWKRDYIYKYPGQKYIYELYSLAADGLPGGEGESKDVFNWTVGAD